MRFHSFAGFRVGRRHPRALAAPFALAVLALFLASGCGGPRMKRLSQEPLPRLDSDAKVDVYVGEVKVPVKEVAIVESDAYSYVDDFVRKKQIEQLKAKARQLGANVLQNVRILTKHVEGYTIDERVPFASWQQGKYELYFMRATAVKMADIEPTSMSDLEPKGGKWIVQNYAPPPKLDASLKKPGLIEQEKK